MLLALKVFWRYKLKPILFSTPMVQAILDGRKTMTRRVIKNKGKNRINENGSYSYVNKKDNTRTGGNGGNIPRIMIDILSPYQAGDILWVRETWGSQLRTRYGGSGYFTVYRADHKEDLYHEDYPKDMKGSKVKWKPSIFMPKKACRIFLRVTNVRVEKLRDISYGDILKEGFNPSDLINPVQDAQNWWITLWNSINGKGAWEANPYVFVYTFQRIGKPC